MEPYNYKHKKKLLKVWLDIRMDYLLEGISVSVIILVHRRM